MSATEFLPEIFRERIEIDGFDRLGLPVVAVVLAAPLGVAGIGPVGGPVAGTLEAGRVHKGLQQGDSLVVEGQPVSLDAPSVQGQDLGGQMLDVDPG